MKTSLTKVAAVALALASGFGAAQAQTISFSGYTWNVGQLTTPDPGSGGQYNPPQANVFTAVDANTATIQGRYGIDSAMMLPITLQAGATVSYDYYLSDNDPGFAGANGGTYYGDWTTVFLTETSLANNGFGFWATDRTISNSGSGHQWWNPGDQTGSWNNNNNNDLNTGLHFLWTFGETSYTLTVTSLVDPTATETLSNNYNNGFNGLGNANTVADIQGFRVGLWDSEQTATLANFTVAVPEPGTMAMLGLGGLVLFLDRRRRG